MMTHFYQKTRKILFSITLLLIFGLAVSGPAFAATTITVDSTAQEVTLANPSGIANGNCTLGEAIVAANTGTTVDNCVVSSAPYTIILAATGYTLTEVADNAGEDGANGLPSIVSTIIIQGNGATITRSGGNAFRLFRVTQPGNLTLNNITLSGGLTAGGSGQPANGGAITNRGGTLLISNSTLSGNTANREGGALYSRNYSGTNPSTTIVNSTIANNSSNAGSSGAVANTWGTLVIINSTIANNGGTATVGGVRGAQISNTIIANNSGSNCNNVTDSGNNLQYADSSCGAGVPVQDPLLGGLANNGGLTQTMLPGVGSPAIDAGNNSVCGNMPVNARDQRGNVRPEGAACDIGAVEVAVVVGSPDFGSNPAANTTINLTTNQGTNSDTFINVFETGTADLVINNITVVGSPEIALTSTTSFTITDDSAVSENVGLQCDATNAGNYSAIVTIFHNGPAASAMYTVNCTVNTVGGETPGGGSTGGTNNGGSTSTVSGGTLEFPAPPPLPSCVADVTNTLFRATVRNMEADSAYCRVLAQDGIIENPGSIGDAWVISQGVIHAVDVFGPNHSMGGTIDICLQGLGGIIYLDANQSPRVPQWMPISVRDGYTCTSIPSAGLVVLTGINNSPMASAAPSSTANAAPVNATPLTACRVTTTNMVNLREAPVDGKVLTILPYDLTLDANARAGDWLRVIYNNTQGWVSATYLTTRGTCG